MVSRQYLTFFVVGVGVTLVTIAVRAALGWLIDDSTPDRYQATIVASYLAGMAIGIFAHKTVTFSFEDRLGVGHFARFGAVHVAGLVSTMLLSGLIRLLSDLVLPTELSKSFAFAAACLIVSVQTYFLNKHVVFVPARPAGEQP